MELERKRTKRWYAGPENALLRFVLKLLGPVRLVSPRDLQAAEFSGPEDSHGGKVLLIAIAEFL
jgi:hypothetical protein